MLKLLSNIIWETFQWVALLGGLLGLVAGLALFFNNPLFFRVAARLNVWVSTRQAMRPLEEPIDVERTLYRLHRLFGALILAGALFTLYVLLLRFKGPELVWGFAHFFRLAVANWIAESLRIFLVVANAAAGLIAVVMIVRPSALKGLEAWANRQYSGRQATRVWEIPRPGPEPIVQAHPRLIGGILAVAGAYVLGAIIYARFLAH
jgi:hypothetical protein